MPEPEIVEIRLVKALTPAFTGDAPTIPYLERWTPGNTTCSYFRLVYRDEEGRPTATRYLGNRLTVINPEELRKALNEARETARTKGLKAGLRKLAEFLDKTLDLKLTTGGKWIKAAKKLAKAAKPYELVKDTDLRRQAIKAIRTLRKAAKNTETNKTNTKTDDLWDLIDAKEYKLSKEERERYLQKLREEEEPEEETEPEEEPDIDQIAIQAIKEVNPNLLNHNTTQDTKPTNTQPKDPTDQFIQALQQANDIQELARLTNLDENKAAKIIDELARKGLIILTTGEIIDEQEARKIIAKHLNQQDEPHIPPASDKERRTVYRIINEMIKRKEFTPSDIAFDLNMSSHLVHTTTDVLKEEGYITEHQGRLKWTGPTRVPYRTVDKIIHQFKQHYDWMT